MFGSFWMFDIVFDLVTYGHYNYHDYHDHFDL